jgi:hypothetical protein
VPSTFRSLVVDSTQAVSGSPIPAPVAETIVAIGRRLLASDVSREPVVHNYDGFIVLALLAILVAWGIGKIRKRVNMRTDRKIYTGIIVVFAIVALALWATHRG